jgi:SIT4-associating protein SAP185/190
MPILLSFLSSEHSWATQTSAGDFLKAIITISANASQNEQSCIGPNELTRQLVSQQCIEKLIADMLKGGNPLTVGVGIVIEVIRKNNSDYDPDVGAEANAIPSSRDPIYLGTLLRMFAQRVPDFMELILSPNHTIGGGDGPVTIRRKELAAAFGGNIEPLGFDRFKTCELMAELLHCSNMGLLNEIGSEEFVKARDLERERLKSEGKLGISPNQQPGALEEDLTMKSSTQTRLGSPDGSRKLEVQNASDDDGFEEVTHAADLGDDAKDDFDEKPGEEDLLTSDKPTPLSFLDKDDDEFVDEPLSSPRLDHIELRPIEPEMMVQPLSPTKELSQQVDSLGLEQDIPMTSPPPSVDSQTDDSESSTTDSEKPTTESSDGSGDSPPQNEQVKVAEHEAAIVEAIPPTDLELLPHPEDKPAPLFANKSLSPETTETAVPDTAVAEPNVSAESMDTTMGEAGDSSNSVMMENTDEQQQSTGEEPPAPVVGDFLKMQFVEHKVVPTILVSQIHARISFSNCDRISSFDFLGITSYIMSSMTLYNKFSMVRWTVALIACWQSIFSKLETLQCGLLMVKRNRMKRRRRIECVLVTWGI